MNRIIKRLLLAVGVVGFSVAASGCHIHPDAVCTYSAPPDAGPLLYATWGRNPIYSTKDHYRCGTVSTDDAPGYQWCMYEDENQPGGWVQTGPYDVDCWW